MTTGTTPTTGATASPPKRVFQGFELTLTVLGAACSAVVTGVLAAEGASTTTKLVGMALGAALPPFVGAVGPGRPVRVGVAVLLAAVAAFIAYGGGQIFAKVSDTEPPLPTPNQIVTNLGGGSGGGGGTDETTGNALEHVDGDLGLRVVPTPITCDEDGRCDPITVTSIGTALLRITSLQFGGNAASYLTASGCEDAVLATGESCTITLEFDAENAPEGATTQLVINQNLPEVPTLVPLEADGVLPADVNLGLGTAECDGSALVDDPDGGVTGELRIVAPLSSSGLADVSSVEAAVYIDGALASTAEVDPNGDSVSIRADYQGPVPEDIRVQIDTLDVVQESNEDDNVAFCSF